MNRIQRARASRFDVTTLLVQILGAAQKRPRRCKTCGCQLDRDGLPMLLQGRSAAERDRLRREWEAMK